MYLVMFRSGLFCGRDYAPTSFTAAARYRDADAAERTAKDLGNDTLVVREDWVWHASPKVVEMTPEQLEQDVYTYLGFTIYIYPRHADGGMSVVIDDASNSTVAMFDTHFTSVKGALAGAELWIERYVKEPHESA